jgi:hypothetical protein
MKKKLKEEMLDDSSLGVYFDPEIKFDLSNIDEINRATQTLTMSD